MRELYIGKVVGTHGIKGEIRIRSDFSCKKRAFEVGTILQIGRQNYEITSYRVHKNYDMVTLKGFDNINQVLDLVGLKVYKDREAITLVGDEYLEEELKDYEIVTNHGKAEFLEIFAASPHNKVIRILLEGREVCVPFQPAFVQVDPTKRQVKVTLIEGM